MEGQPWRGIVFGIIFLLTGCQPRSPDAIYAQISTLRHEDLNSALPAARAAFESFQHSSDPVLAWRFRILYVDTLLDVPKIEEAKSLLERGEPPGGERLREQRARFLLAQARLQQKLNNTEKSEELYIQAEKALDGVHNACLDAELTSHQVQNLIDGDKLDEAEARLKARETAVSSCSEPYSQVITLWLHGEIQSSRGRWEEAIEFYEQSLGLARHNAVRLAPPLLGNLASLHLRLGDTDRALAELDEGEPIYAATGKALDYAIDQGRRGSIYRSRGEMQSAESCFRGAMKGATDAHSRPYQAHWLNELSTLYLENGQLAAARQANEQALQVADPVEDKSTFEKAQLNAARILRGSGQFEHALAATEPLRGKVNSKELRWEVLGERAQLLAELHRAPEARREFAAAIQAVEEQRRALHDDWNWITFTAKTLELYRAYVDFLVSIGDTREALALADSSHGRRLVERLESQEVIEPVRDPTRVARVQKAAILSYWLGHKTSYLWVANEHGSRMFPLPPKEKLEAEIRAVREQIHDKVDLLRQPQLAQRLYRELIGPAAGLLGKNPDVIVIPDGLLADLNFDTLVVPGAMPRYWMESATIRVAPSLALLHRTEAIATNPMARLLVVGNTDPPLPWPPLPGSKRQIDTIERLFTADHPVLLQGPAATPRAFLAAEPQNYSLIHLAAHALPIPESPLESAIVFSPQKNGVFKLYARDLAKLRLKTDLVTLSACQGAGSKTVPGEGLVGLTWAFLSAGAHHVVAGLWDVPDAGTADLMDYFYQALKDGMTPEQALHQAKMKMRHAPPYFWAAFQMYSR